MRAFEDKKSHHKIIAMGKRHSHMLNHELLSKNLSFGPEIKDIKSNEADNKVNKKIKSAIENWKYSQLRNKNSEISSSKAEDSKLDKIIEEDVQEGTFRQESKSFKFSSEASNNSSFSEVDSLSDRETQRQMMRKKFGLHQTTIYK